jgi:TIR domain
MRSDRLFAGPDFHSVLEHEKARLVQAYEQLPDAEALDDEVQKNLKAEFLLDVPVLRPQGEQWVEERTAKVDVTRLPNRMPGFGNRPILEEVPEFTVHVPFDGDSGVFKIAPSRYDGSSIHGQIVGNEILLTFLQAMPGMNLQRSLDDTIRQINSNLTYFREQTIVFQQGLDAALARAMMSRKQRLELRSNAVSSWQIPLRSAAPRKIPSPIVQPAQAKPGPQAKPEMWDVFISHASEDDSYIDILKRTFVAAGIRVWVDDDVLRWGDRLRSSIDNGLKRSRFVIVVLSKAFLGVKKWTEYELDSAFALETVNRERILPLWHGITHEELVKYSPGLSNRIALNSSKQSPTDLANQLLILLGRRSEHAFPVAETVPVAEPQSHATEEVQRGETVAYTWYWTKDGKIAGLYVRQSSSRADLFTLEEPDGTVHVGGTDDIAVKYFAADSKLRRDGLKRSSVMNSGSHPEFNLP